MNVPFFVRIKSVPSEVYKLTVVSPESQQKFLKQNFSIFVVTPSICVGTQATLVMGFLQHLYKNDNYTLLQRNATKSLSNTIASNTFLLSSKIIELG